MSPQYQEIGFSVSLASATESSAVAILVATSFLSFFAVAALLVTLVRSAIKASGSNERGLFVKNQVAAYFVCLVLCWIVQSTGSAFSVSWLQDKAVSFGGLCTAQAIFKQIANVGTAVWTLAIAVHAFVVLFLDIKVSKYITWIVLAVGWGFITFTCYAGPAFISRTSTGAFYGVAGLSCGVTSEYEVSGLFLSETMMLLAAFFGPILCLLSFLRTRGNVIRDGYKFSFCKRGLENPEKCFSEDQLVVKQVLLHPVVYAIFMAPSAIVTIAHATSVEMPLEVTVVSGCLHMMAGLVSVLIFILTRRLLPASVEDAGFTFIGRPPISDAQAQAEKGASKTVTFAAEPTILCTPPAGRRQSKRPRPLDFTFRESFDSMYSTREGQYLAPLSSHWSPDTPPLFKKSRLSRALEQATTIAQRI